MEKIFEIFGKKIFYAITAFYWAVFFFGEKLGFELSKIPSDLYKYLVIGIGLLGTAFVFVDIAVLLGIFIRNNFEYHYAKKEKKEYYLKAINTIERYGDIDGLGILLSLLSFPSIGEHWQKAIPQNCQKREVYNVLQLFSEVRIDKNGYSRVLSINNNYHARFDFNKGFFEFLEEEYFVKNQHKKIDLASNFLTSKTEN